MSTVAAAPADTTPALTPVAATPEPPGPAPVVAADFRLLFALVQSVASRAALTPVRGDGASTLPTTGAPDGSAAVPTALVVAPLVTTASRGTSTKSTPDARETIEAGAEDAVANDDGEAGNAVALALTILAAPTAPAPASAPLLAGRESEAGDRAEEPRGSRSSDAITRDAAPPASRPLVAAPPVAASPIVASPIVAPPVAAESSVAIASTDTATATVLDHRGATTAGGTTQPVDPLAPSRSAEPGVAPVTPPTVNNVGDRARARTTLEATGTEPSVASVGTSRQLAQFPGDASRLTRHDLSSETSATHAPHDDHEAPVAPLPSAAATAPVDATPRPLGAAAGEGESPRASGPRHVVEQVVARLTDVRHDGRHEMSLRLDPPDLGGVRIEARLEGTRLSVQIRAEQAPTRDLLVESLPRLRESLAQGGFQPEQVSVHLGLDGSGRRLGREDAPAFTPPPSGETDAHPRPGRVAAPHGARSRAGLDVWA